MTDNKDTPADTNVAGDAPADTNVGGGIERVDPQGRPIPGVDTGRSEPDPRTLPDPSGGANDPDGARITVAPDGDADTEPDTEGSSTGAHRST